MVVTTVQHVTQAASEGLNAKFSDLCDPHDLSSIRTAKKTIFKLTAKSSAKSRASSKATIRQLRNQERRLSVSSSTDDDAFLMSFTPTKMKPKLLSVRSGFNIAKITGSPLHLACSSPRTKGRGVTKKLLRLCMGSSPNKYTPLTVC